MEPLKKPQTCPWWRRHPAWFLLLLLAAVLAALFARSFVPEYILFSNDGPLGAMASQAQLKWSNFHGVWQDLNSVGSQGMSNNLSVHQLMDLALNSVAWAKFFAPLTLLMLGLAAGFFFRRLGLSYLACVLGALAAMLNTGFFSPACWGVAPQAICVACSFVAMGLLVQGEDRLHWVRVVLAGMAVGMGVVEGYDIGALFSMCVAVFLVFQAWMTPGSPGRRVVWGISRLLVVVCFAGLIAVQTISSLISTQIKGVVGTQQDARTKMERWDFATQWSLPKVEALTFVVPGLFGYRMETPEGGNYWGAMGRDPAWDRFFASGAQGTPPLGFMRQSGGGSYAGVLVVLVAAWAVVQSFRKDKSVFALAHRKAIWFWSALGLAALLLAFGRFAPFYQLIYALPFISVMRNPVKFTYFVELATVILFAYGMHGLSRRYLESPLLAAAGLTQHLRTWWGRVRGFDRQWTLGCLGAIGLSALAWMIYSASRPKLETYLQTVQFDADTAKAIAGFSVQQPGWFILFLVLAIGAVTLVLSGFFAGRRAKWAGVLLGALLILDLSRVNLHFIVYWDRTQKYASNEVLDFLRHKPYEHRVAILPFRLPPQFSLLDQLYRIEWAQHHFLLYNIQSLDIVQMPRMPEDLAAFELAFAKAGTPGLLRRWALTNTRYLLGPADFAEGLNQQLDPQLNRFSNALRFTIEPKPGITAPRTLPELTAVVATNGQYAVIEFAGALPRAGLYSQWIVQTNDAQALELLVSPGFNPAQTVVIATNLPVAPAAGTNQSAGTVAFVSYTPKDLVLKAQAKTQAVLLLNDKYNPNWQALVDGHPAPLLRCNYLMRGVQVPPGEHVVEFRFATPENTLYISVAAVALGLGLCGVLALYWWKQPTAGVQS
ncbi:MAG: hypothetical protein ABSD29_20760 [Verrucomicrobiota bacterium]|jgi:hypothetical protein